LAPERASPAGDRQSVLEGRWRVRALRGQQVGASPNDAWVSLIKRILDALASSAGRSATEASSGATAPSDEASSEHLPCTRGRREIENTVPRCRAKDLNQLLAPRRTCVTGLRSSHLARNTRRSMQVQADAVVVKLNLQPLADAMQADAADAVAEINARAHLLTSNALGDAASIREGASAPLMAASNFSNPWGRCSDAERYYWVALFPLSVMTCRPRSTATSFARFSRLTMR
jgi:hypothetical protein